MASEKSAETSTGEWLEVVDPSLAPSEPVKQDKEKKKRVMSAEAAANLAAARQRALEVRKQKAEEKKKIKELEQKVKAVEVKKIEELHKELDKQLAPAPAVMEVEKPADPVPVAAEEAARGAGEIHQGDEETAKPKAKRARAPAPKAKTRRRRPPSPSSEESASEESSDEEQRIRVSRGHRRAERYHAASQLAPPVYPTPQQTQAAYHAALAAEQAKFISQRLYGFGGTGVRRY